MNATGDGTNAADDIKDGNLLGARAIFLQNQTARELFWGYAKDANRASSGKTRKEFSKAIRKLVGENQLSNAEADYCAGWAALAAQMLEGAGDEHGKLEELLKNAVPLDDEVRIVGG